MLDDPRINTPTRGTRGRSGKGRGGRGRPSGKNNEEEESARQSQQQTNEEKGMETKQWLQESLENLGHFDPSSVIQAMNVNVDEKNNAQTVADEQLVSLTLWLEDRLIRIWALEERNKLSTDFWANIEEYLEALECPKGYYSSLKGQEKNDTLTTGWQHSHGQRIRVVHWLIACATSEAVGDMASQKKDRNNDTPLVETTTLETKSPPKLFTDLGQFGALGFSTGDEEVDRILSLLRMRLLVQLEEDQKEVNDLISQLQSVTAGKAKPLKEAKPRKQKHNPNASPPSKKPNTMGKGRR